MDIHTMARELAIIQKLVGAYEALDDAQYENAAIEALEAVKAQINALAECLAEAAQEEAAA